MAKKPTYEELEQRVKELYEEAVKRKQSEETLRESEERFRLLYERAPLGYQSLDEHGHFLEVNRAWLDTLGYSREEVIGKSFGDFLHRDWVDHFKQNFPRFKAVGEILGVEFEMMKKDGSLIMVAFNGKIGRDEKGDFKQTHCILQDITPQKKSEEALRESEERTRQYLDIAKVIFVAIDTEGNITLINQRGLEILGYLREELLGKNWFKTCLPDRFQKDILDVYHQLIRGEVEPAEYYENPVLTKDGKERMIAWHNSVLRNPDGEIVGTLSSGEDITERVLAEEALLESEEKYRLLVANQTDLLVKVDCEGRFQFVSPSYCRMFGKTEEELLGKTFMPLVHPDDRKSTVKEMEKLYHLPHTAYIEQRAMTKDGWTWLAWMDTAILDEKGNVTEIIGLGRDITDRKRSEEVLRESEERFRGVFESKMIGIFFWNADGDIIDANDSFLKMVGYTKDELLSGEVRWRDMTPPEYTEQDERALQEIASTGVITPIEKEYIRKDGTRIPILLGAASLQASSLSGAAFVLDITERKRTEEALLEERDKAQRYLDLAGVIFVAINRKGEVTLINQKGCEVLGYNEEEIVGKNWFENFIPGWLKEDLIPVSKRLLNGKVESVEYNENPILTKSGEERMIAWHNTILRDTEGNISGHLSSGEDITERKLAEESLRQSEQKYRNIFNNAQVGIFRTRISDGKVLECNDRFAQTYGYKTRQECIDEFILSEHYTEPGGREKMTASIMEKGQVNDIESCFSRKDGEEVWIRFSARAYPEEGYLEGVGYDITEEKRALEALRESEEKFRQLSDLLPQVIFETDAEGNLTFTNRAAFDLFGYTREDFEKGLNALHMIIPEDHERAVGNIQRILRGEKLGGTEYTALTRDGRTYPVIIYSSPIISEDKTKGLRGIMVDLTEVKRTQKALLESEEKLARSKRMEAMGLMAGGVAHDLNNILSGIVSYPELLLMDLPEDSPLRKPIKTIQESGMRAADVVEDLLTIARGVATGKEPLNLNTLVTEYLGSAEYEKLEKTHSFVSYRTELDPDLLNMSGSPTHIKKILMNLIANATEAIEGSGTVTISTINQYLDEPLKGYEDVRIGEYTVLKVSDDGSGISPEDLERIFEPFYTKKMMGRSGTGLGLAVVWNSMQDHDGYINVKSSHKGTVFELYFPVTREEVAAEEEEVPLEDYLGHGEKILVVDDEERQREIASGILTRLGYTAEAVSSGEDAIEYVKTNSVDLILLDMVMPKGINGWKTYEEIIKIRPGQKAIIASGYAKTKEVDLAQELGAGKYIKKPYTLTKVGLAVKEELEK